MSFHLCAVQCAGLHAARNKKASGYRDVISTRVYERGISGKRENATRMAVRPCISKGSGILNPATYLSGRINKNRWRDHSDATLMKIVASALTAPITAARSVD